MTTMNNKNSSRVTGLILAIVWWHVPRFSNKFGGSTVPLCTGVGVSRSASRKDAATAGTEQLAGADHLQGIEGGWVPGIIHPFRGCRAKPSRKTNAALAHACRPRNANLPG